MSRMLAAMDIEQVRVALDSRRGEWSKIATGAGINRKTVWRIMVDPQYNPTLRTMRALAAALAQPAEEAGVGGDIVKEAA